MTKMILKCADREGPLQSRLGSPYRRAASGPGSLAEREDAEWEKSLILFFDLI